MPYQIKSKGNKFSVENEITGYKYSKGTTKKKALGQIHMLYGINNGFVPMHNYYSKVIPLGGKKNSMEK